MSNYETAKLVRSVVSDRDLIPVMTHFHMYNGRLQGTNGKLTLDASWPEYLSEESINIPAEPFVKAFEAMDDPNLILKDEFLYVTEGRMRVRIPTNLEVFPVCHKPEKWDPMDNSILHAIRHIREFVSDDASRPWACSVLYLDGYLYATNNVTIVRTPWNVSSFSDVESFTLPSFGIDQLVRCNREVTAIHVRTNAIGFEMEGDVWMESVRYTEKWPEVSRFFDDVEWNSIPKLRGDEKGIVEKLLPFVPDKRHPVIKFEGDKISTMEGAMEAAIDTNCGYGAFHATPLLKVLTEATAMDLEKFPKVPFEGPYIEGIIAGVHI